MLRVFSICEFGCEGRDIGVLMDSYFWTGFFWGWLFECLAVLAAMLLSRRDKKGIEEDDENVHT